MATERRRLRRLAATAFVVLAVSAGSAAAQQTPAPPPETGPKVGEMAPDFTLPGSTRYGRLLEPVNLGSLRGNTVVLAFFVKARTRG